MTQQHEHRYQTSAYRNMALFKFRNGHTPRSNGTVSEHIHYPHFAGMELNDLKHHVGVRSNDSKFDDVLVPWLHKVKDHAIKNKIAANKPKKAEPTVVSELKEGQTVSDLRVAAPDAKPTLKVVYSADDASTHHGVEKKPNPKKEARKAALEKSGTMTKGNATQTKAQVINADARRAEVMAARPQCQPRILKR